MNPVVTDEWKKYQAGKDYNEKLTPVDLYTTVDNNESFYAGDQWIGVSAKTDFDRVVVNIFKKVINFIVNSCLAFRTKLRFTPLLIGDNPEEGSTEEELLEMSKQITKYSDTLWERLKMDNLSRQALLDAALSGDACAHLWWNKNIETGQISAGDIDIELIDNVNVFFGNPHSSMVNHNGYAVQPYIIISKREMVGDLKEQATKNYENKHRQNKVKSMMDKNGGKLGEEEVKKIFGEAVTLTKDEKSNIEKITSDKDDQYQSGYRSKIDIDNAGNEDGKAISLTCYFKKDGTIWYKKVTKYATICEEYNTKYRIYPIAWMNWDSRKNSYHGQALGTGIIPNQVMINKSYSAISLWLRKMALPTIIYDKGRIRKWNFNLGAAIGVESVDGPISNSVYVLQPGQLGGMVLNCLQDIIANTKEMLGVSTVSLGEVDNPENTSAIKAVQKAGAIPIEGNRAAFYQFHEDIGYIELELMSKHYGIRKVSTLDDSSKSRIITEIDFNRLSELPMQIKVDVGASSYWSETADVVTLDNLLQNQYIDFEQYLEQIPDGVLSGRDTLLAQVKEKLLAQAQMQEQMPAENMQPQAMPQQM